MTTILTLVPVTRRGFVMGNVSIAISVAPAMGPTVSGLILEHFSWRFMFVFVLPIAVAAFAIGARFLTNIGENEKTRLDVLSVLLTVPAFGGLVYGLSQIGGGEGGPGSPGRHCAGRRRRGHGGVRPPPAAAAEVRRRPCWTCAPSPSGCSRCPCCCWWWP